MSTRLAIMSATRPSGRGVGGWMGQSMSMSMVWVLTIDPIKRKPPATWPNTHSYPLRCVRVPLAHLTALGYCVQSMIRTCSSSALPGSPLFGGAIGGFRGWEIKRERCQDPRCSCVNRGKAGREGCQGLTGLAACRTWCWMCGVEGQRQAPSCWMGRSVDQSIASALLPPRSSLAAGGRLLPVGWIDGGRLGDFHGANGA